MSLISFDALPDDARLWCFGSSRPTDAEETAHLVRSMQRFMAEWTAHRRDLQAGFDWLDDRFLLIGVDESSAGASGCSIDALSGHLRDLGTQLGLDLLDSMPVWFRDASGQVRSISRPHFADLASNGDVSGSTLVFDLTLTRLGDLRAGRFETSANSVWHRDLLTQP